MLGYNNAVYMKMYMTSTWEKEENIMIKEMT